MSEAIDFQAAREKTLAQTRDKLETAFQQRYDALLAQQRSATGTAYEALNRELNTVGPALDALRNSKEGTVQDLEAAVRGAQTLVASTNEDTTILSFGKKPNT